MTNIFDLFFILFCILVYNTELQTVSSFSIENVYCSDEFCKEYLEKNECKNFGPTCTVQNETCNGKLFSSATPCNCCKDNYFIKNLREGQLCSIGSPDMPIPDIVCGQGLVCVKDENGNNSNDYYCRKMKNTACLKDQIKYDEQKNSTGTAGLFIQRPICDTDNGLYASIKCNIDQTCFCVDENGKRIFGEALYEETIEKTMKCACSQLHANFSKKKNSKYPLQTARCLENGNYDSMQCIDDKCTCVNVNTGAIKYWTTFNSSSVAYDKIPCFNKTIHSKYNYLHDCEMKQWIFYKQYEKSIKNGYGVINVDMQKCEPDGWYSTKQENDTHLYCVDKYGRIIDNYVVLKNSRISQNMNCKCTRTLYIIMENMERKTIGRNTNIPQCCPNGNFKKIQCRNDICYCCDDNGLQISVEQHISNVTNLECYNGGIMC